MTDDFTAHLNKITDRLLSEELLSNAGLGNEIGFYIFDYPPEKELLVRDYIETVKGQLHKRKPDLRFTHVNLFELIVGYLESRKILDQAFKLQKTKGNEELLKALRGPLHPQKIANHFVQITQPEEQDLVLMSGVGNAWPLLRGHNLLNCLHPLMEDTPLVMFYPGHFTGQGLRLFSRLRESNYYRAFSLVS